MLWRRDAECIERDDLLTHTEPMNICHRPNTSTQNCKSTMTAISQKFVAAVKRVNCLQIKVDLLQSKLLKYEEEEAAIKRLMEEVG